VTVTWDWGDGTTTTEDAIATHTFPDYSAHTITATDGPLTGSVIVPALPLWDIAVWDTTEWGD
jgi:PKD repeat protein